MSRWGITLPLEGVRLADQGEWVRELVDCGYTDLWSLETAGFDAFTPLAAAAPFAGEARLGTAIASAFTRGPALLAMSAAALCELAPGRVVVGIGSSSETIVRGWNDISFERPVERVRAVLRFLRAALTGARVEGEFDALRVRGFRLERPPESPPPLFVAALREQMLRLAGAEADGVLLGLLAAEDVEKVVSVMERTRPEALRSAEVVLRLGVYPSEDAERARRACRRVLAAYLCSGPYARFHEWLGRGPMLEPLWKAWREGDRRGAVDAVPDWLVDALFIHGSPESCRGQVERFVEAGVTTPILHVMPFGGDLRTALRALSPAAATRTR